MGGNRRLEEIEKNRRDFLFVVLYHRLPEPNPRKSHWDLLLENPSNEGFDLLAFALQAPFEDWKQERTIKLANHRRLYLDYEGPISEDRGDVSKVQQGTVRWISLEPQRFEFTLQCQSLGNQGPRHWCELSKDPSADNVWDLLVKPAT